MSYLTRLIEKYEGVPVLSGLTLYRFTEAIFNLADTDPDPSRTDATKLMHIAERLAPICQSRKWGNTDDNWPYDYRSFLAACHNVSFFTVAQNHRLVKLLHDAIVYQRPDGCPSFSSPENDKAAAELTTLKAKLDTVEAYSAGEVRALAMECVRLRHQLAAVEPIVKAAHVIVRAHGEAARIADAEGAKGAGKAARALGAEVPKAKKGDRQKGDRQKGDRQKGDRQKDDRQKDDRQKDDRQKDDRQKDDRQKDDKQKGDKQKGDKQKGDKQKGDKQKADKQKAEKQKADKQKAEKKDEKKDEISFPPRW